ncbi:MAG: hypothetical protein PHU85_00735 [Phycisphaerae bacterium]|nr:hypothetical protein [Phycisphaerae bacterium]
MKTSSRLLVISSLILMSAPVAHAQQRSTLGVSGVGSVPRIGTDLRGVGGIYQVPGISGYGGFGNADVNAGPLTTTTGQFAPSRGPSVSGLAGSLRIVGSASALAPIESMGSGARSNMTTLAIPDLTPAPRFGGLGGVTIPSIGVGGPGTSLPFSASRSPVMLPVDGPSATAAMVPKQAAELAGSAPLPGGTPFDLAGALKSNAHWRRGVELLKAAQFAQAADAIRVGLAFGPNRAEGEWLLAVADAGLEDYADAVFRLRNALSLSPDLLSQRRGADTLLPAAVIAERARLGSGAATAERRLVAAWLAYELQQSDAGTLTGPTNDLVGAAVPVAAALQAALAASAPRRLDPGLPRGVDAPATPPAAEPSGAPARTGVGRR